jgi:hypothetical protein
MPTSLVAPKPVPVTVTVPPGAWELGFNVIDPAADAVGINCVEIRAIESIESASMAVAILFFVFLIFPISPILLKHYQGMMYLVFFMQQWFDAKKFGFSIMQTNILSIEMYVK